MSEVGTKELMIEISGRSNKGDVIILSNDENPTRFLVHQKDLCYHSSFFSDLFELGKSEEKAEIKLDFSAAILELGLAYCYPGSKPPLVVSSLSNGTLLGLCRFFDFTQISEGPDAIREGLFIEVGTFRAITSYDTFACLFAKKFSYPSLFHRAMQELSTKDPIILSSFLRRELFDWYRLEANHVGFMILSRFSQFILLKRAKESSLSAEQSHEGLCSAKSTRKIWNAFKDCEYSTLQSLNPPILLVNSGCEKCDNLYAKAVAELRAETRALKIEAIE